MAVLPVLDRDNVKALFMKNLSNLRESLTINKIDLGDTINSIDDWIDSNMASFNSVLPQVVKQNLTQNQKVRLFMLIIKRRWEVT